jgi:putative transposase
LRYRTKGRGQAMREKVRETALRHKRFGHRRVAWRLERELGRPVSRRNVQRIMQEEKLQVRTRRRRKWAPRETPAQCAAERPDTQWAMDFVSDWCVGARRQLRILTLVDCCTREALAVRAGYSMPARRVVETLEQMRSEGRKPAAIRIDNGPEFVAAALVMWCRAHGVELSYIERGKPHQNGYAESFNGRLRDECLNGHYFLGAEDAQSKLNAWREEYHNERPHSALNGMTPAEKARELRVRTPFAPPMVNKASACPCQGNPAGELRSALTETRTGQRFQISGRRA